MVGSSTSEDEERVDVTAATAEGTLSGIRTMALISAIGFKMCEMKEVRQIQASGLGLSQFSLPELVFVLHWFHISDQN